MLNGGFCMGFGHGFDPAAAKVPVLLRGLRGAQSYPLDHFSLLNRGMCFCHAVVFGANRWQAAYFESASDGAVSMLGDDGIKINRIVKRMHKASCPYPPDSSRLSMERWGDVDLPLAQPLWSEELCHSPHFGTRTNHHEWHDGVRHNTEH
jgi:hypothetical protein